ncbi:MAG: enoyl-CoA hydratase/isomerase family protein [Actinobacteria bacterium]|nr:enoyl-CoA hydratase/isomerase family protein [Actinomycetota bacterium]
MLRLERRADGVRNLILDDPDKRNAIGPVMREELLAAVSDLRADAEARVLVVSGAGKAFCAGADLGAIFDSGGRTPAEMRDRQLAYYESFLGIGDLPFPTVAAVDGAAIGAGLNLALVCDITLAGPHAKFGVTFAKLGLHPGGGCTYFLTRAVGPGRALRAMLLGSVIGGEEAARIGLADDYSEDPLAAAEELATAVAQLEPSLARDMKKAVAIAAADSLEAAVGFESWAQTASAFYPGVVEGIRAAGRSTAR